MQKFIIPLIAVGVIVGVGVVAYYNSRTIDESVSVPDAVAEQSPDTSPALPPEDSTDEGPDTSADTLTFAKLTALQQELDAKNEQQDFPATNTEPSVIGVFNGMTVTQQFYCTDVCPDNGLYLLAYEGISENECALVGGYEVRKWGWGLQFVGCSPTKNTFTD